jgi:hypothetical protein
LSVCLVLFVAVALGLGATTAVADPTTTSLEVMPPPTFDIVTTTSLEIMPPPTFEIVTTVTNAPTTTAPTTTTTSLAATTTTVADAGDGLATGWIALIVVAAAAALGGVAYGLGKKSKKS